MSVTEQQKPALTDEARAARDEFLDLAPAEALEVWHGLPAPRFTEVQGEYDGQFLRTVSAEVKAHLDATWYNEDHLGDWLGKSYLPLGQVSGEGYNRFRRADGRVERRLRFGTHLGTSRIDGQAAMIMTYGSFNRSVTPTQPLPAWQIDLVDELRQLAPGVIVGVGTVPLWILQLPGNEHLLDLQRAAGLQVPEDVRLGDRSDPSSGLFVLSGPSAPAVGPDDPDEEDQ